MRPKTAKVIKSEPQTPKVQGFVPKNAKAAALGWTVIIGGGQTTARTITNVRLVK